MKTSNFRPFCSSPRQIRPWWKRLRLVTPLIIVLALLPAMPVSAVDVVINPIVATPGTPISFDSLQSSPPRPLPIKLNTTFNDLGSGETHSVLINWDDGTTCEADGVAPDLTASEYCSINNDANTVEAKHTYAAPGVYAPIMIITSHPSNDRRGRAYTFVVIYDDTSGHIKGAGGYRFPHQYNQFDTASGPAQFGFTFGYNANGTFRSNSRARFELFDSNFNSVFAFSATSFNWMVISRPNALLSGRGIVDETDDGIANGTSYDFVISIIDGALRSPPGPDRFRIRISPIGRNGAYYDNEFLLPNSIMLADPVTTISGDVVIVTTSGSAAGFTSATGREVIVIGDAPQEAIDNIGLSERLFMPLVEE